MVFLKRPSNRRRSRYHGNTILPGEENKHQRTKFAPTKIQALSCKSSIRLTFCRKRLLQSLEKTKDFENLKKGGKFKNHFKLQKPVVNLISIGCYCVVVVTPVA